MWKSVLAGATALAIAGGSIVYAQQRHDGRAQHWRPSAEDMSAFTDARIAGLKTALRLSPDQEKNWPALETAMRDAGKARSERFAARASADKPKDPVERLKLRAETMTQRGATLKKVADAAAPLYQGLDDAQKHRFTMLAQLDAHRRFGHWRHHEHGGRGVMHRPHGPGAPGDNPPPPRQ